ncbi:hypothetical protein AXG93_1860s1120 [Marchantia polymorpha subsp. ruderalis]|uniref:VOC domain-containing protein n=1 Tax=Marchantia polymorpha subsp. ruderalis TaxID=1480154 RepID=A0A176VFS8_MARPO|nr:hypothetical protein AXG93_1860s1120 [Marchantia polymorpha subsp. ruderalis]
MHHVGLLCENLERSLEFYQGILGLELNPDRPADKLPYRGAWFWVGAEMIHLMELPNPDPITGRPEHGGRDRHACVAIKSVEPLKRAFEKAGISFTLSKSGRPAIFARDPDGNALEFTQLGATEQSLGSAEARRKEWAGTGSFVCATLVNIHVDNVACGLGDTSQEGQPRLMSEQRKWPC